MSDLWPRQSKPVKERRRDLKQTNIAKDVLCYNTVHHPTGGEYMSTNDTRALSFLDTTLKASPTFAH